MILIYTNSGGYGGVEILTQRFIQYLSERNIDFRIAERAGTRLYSMLPSEKIIEPESIERFGKFFSHAFFPSVSRMRPIGHQWEYLRHVKALGWIVHPNEPIRSFIPFAGKLVDLFGYTGISWLQFLFCYHNKLVDHFFRTSLLKQGLIAMDGATVRSLKHFFKDLGDVPYVPIPAPTIAQTNGRKASTPTTHVGYLGRIDAFKMSALKPFLEHSLAGRDVCFHIVGEGPELGHLIELCQRKDIRYIN